MQEEVTGKAVAIIIDGAKISEHTLEKAIKAFLEAQKNKGTKIHRGKQRLKQLAGQNAGLANIEITDKNIKSPTVSVMLVLTFKHSEYTFHSDVSHSPRPFVFIVIDYSIAISISSKELKKYKTHTEIIEALQSLDYIYHIEEMWL